MAFDFAVLEPRIHGILSAPGTDLSTISAKRVRRQLLELDSSLTYEFIKEHKDEIDSIISNVFEQVSAEQIADEGDADVKEEEDDEDDDQVHTSPSRKRKQHKQEDDDEDEDVSPPPKKAKKTAKKGQELSDAQLARKLSSEINGRSTRGVKGGRAAQTPKRGRAKKSAATVDSDDGSDDDGSHGASKRKKKPAGSGGAKGGFAKEFTLSEALSTVLQVDKLSRPQVVKQLWVYIKGNELQNPLNKKEIMCDTNLRAVFGVDKIDMFKMNKVLGQHLHEAE